jgi:hypothetical protein
MTEPFMWAGVSYHELYEGPMRGETPMELPVYSAEGWNDPPRGGSVSGMHWPTFEEAVADIDRLRADRDYDHWCVTRIERFARMVPMPIPAWGSSQNPPALAGEQ